MFNEQEPTVEDADNNEAEAVGDDQNDDDPRPEVIDDVVENEQNEEEGEPEVEE